MTEDLIAMAKECGFNVFSGGIRDNGDSSEYLDCWPEQLEAFAALIEARAVARTREECAALVQANADACEPGSMLQVYLASNAAAIRALGERT